MRQILSICKRPPLVGLQGCAFPLSIIFQNNTQEYLPWLYSRYIQLIFNKDLLDFQYHEDDWMFVSSCIVENKHTVYPWEVYENPALILASIRQMIDLGYVMLSTFNEKYIPGKFCYQRNDFTHDFMLYGYDTDKDTVLIFGYTNQGTCEELEITAAQLLEGMKAGNNHECVLNFFRRTQTVPPFDYQRCKTFLRDYLACSDSSGIYDGNFCVGLQCNDLFIQCVDEALKRKTALKRWMFYTLWEHKVLMDRRLGYLLENHYFDDEALTARYSIVERQAKAILNLVLKYNATNKLRHDTALLAQIRKQLREITVAERDVLQQVYHRCFM